MKDVECEFESEVLAAVFEARWPGAAEPFLREHVSRCAVCSDVVAIADAFETARQQTHSEATLPDASRIWWFAQLRARREAAREAGRPILATQIAAFAWAVGLMAVCVGTAVTWFQVVRGWLGAIVEGMAGAGFPFLEHGVLILAGMSLIIVLPAAAYLAMGKE